MKQLTFWEEDKLSEFRPIKYWSVRSQNKNLVPNVPVVFLNYLINRRGQIYSKLSDKILTQTKRDYDPYIYAYIKIFNQNYNTRFSLHRLVACTFVECFDKKTYNFVDHIDGNKINNHYLNLRWVTNSQNQLARYTNINQLDIL